MSIVQEINVEEHPALCKLHEAAALANECRIEYKDGQWETHGDSVDCALSLMAKKAGFDKESLLKKYPYINSIPYESQQKFAASFHEKKGKAYVFVKGAVETLLEMCSTQLTETGNAPLSNEAIKQQEKELSTQQYRVLAFAYGEVELKKNYTKEDLTNLSFLGMAGMIDPLRAEAKPAIEACRGAGIEVVMVTGDHPDTAFAIARELSLSKNKQEVVTGKQLNEAKEQSNDALDALTSKSKVYARVEPGQKLDIVDSLIRGGHFVAVTGDGVNDAPALKHAHVGVAMGKGGTDVARESSEIIITDDNFASIISGIEEGRTAYANIRKIVFFLISTSMAEVFMFLGAILLALPIPLFATQLLWLNFATSIIQDVAHAFDPPEGDELKKPPRDPEEPIFDRLMTSRITIIAMVMGCISLAEFYWMLTYGNYSDADARNIILLQFVLFENVIAINSRSENISFFAQPLMKNPLLIYGTLLAQAMHIAAMYMPGLSDVLYIKPVSLIEWSALLCIALIPMAVIELEKWIRRKWFPA